MKKPHSEFNAIKENTPFDIKKDIMIFLDVDGVMHPINCDDIELFMNTSHVEDVLEHFQNAKIVLHTTRLLDTSFMHVMHSLSPKIQSRVVGYCSPQDLTDNGGFTEINEYLKNAFPLEYSNNYSSIKWIAINNKKHLFIENKKEVVAPNKQSKNIFFCDPAVGLDDFEKVGLEWKMKNL